MMRVLVFGDSNSWGYLDDGSGQRYEMRWPVVMKAQLQQHLSALELIEDCLPGRTTDLPDPVMGAEFNGKAALPASIKAHQPLDTLLIMLGTNDFKQRFARTEADIAHAIKGLITVAQHSGAGPDGWHADTPPNIAIICPPELGSRADDKSWERAEEWQGGRAKSSRLPQELAKICAEMKVGFIDSNQGAKSSSIDPIHWQAETHYEFGKFMAEKLSEMITRNAQK